MPWDPRGIFFSLVLSVPPNPNSGPGASGHLVPFGPETLAGPNPLWSVGLMEWLCELFPQQFAWHTCASVPSPGMGIEALLSAG